MEETLKQKQLFLRENILDKGYNADNFMNLLHSKKGESGLDLNNWTMDELSSVVTEFTSMLNQNEDQNNNVNINTNNSSQNNNNIESDEYYEQICLQKLREQKLKEEEEYGKCSIIEKSELSKQHNIEIKISFPEKIDKGIFTKSFTSYLVETLPFKFQVRKRFSDFEWLQNILNTQFSNYVIPSIPHKNYGDRFTEALILKRTRMLKKFLDGLLVHPTMKHSIILYDFLSVNSEEDFEEIKKKYNNLNNSSEKKGLEEIKTVNGNIKVSVSKEKDVYLTNIKDNAEINESIMKRITKSYKNLMDLMRNVSEKMKEIAELWKLLHEKSLKYYETTNTIESYNIMNKIMEDLSNFENKKIEIMNNNIREYIRYVKNEFHSMKDLAKKVDTYKDNYSKAFEKLNNNKENLFKQQDLSLWGLNETDMQHKVIFLKNKDLAFSKMLPEESKNVLDIKNIYGAYLNSVIDEYERIRLLNGRRHKDNISRFIKLLSESLTELHISVADKSAYFDEVKDEEEIDENEQLNDNNINNQYNNNMNNQYNNNSYGYNNRQFNDNNNNSYANRNNNNYNNRMNNNNNQPGQRNNNNFNYNNQYNNNQYNNNQYNNNQYNNNQYNNNQNSNRNFRQQNNNRNRRF